MKVAFYNAVGGRMLVDESRVDEYLAAGYKLAADVIDTTATVVEDEVSEAAPTPAPKRRRKKEV